MKFFVKYFENYDAMMRENHADVRDFSELPCALKMQIVEKEFEYARLKIWFHSSVSCPNSAPRNDQYVAIAISFNKNNDKIKIIFKGILEKIDNISNKIIMYEYAAKSRFLEDEGEKNRNIRAGNTSIFIKNNSEITKNKFWYCDKISHNFSKINLKGKHNYINLSREYILNFNEFPIKSDRIDVLNLDIKFKMRNHRIFKEDIYQKIAQKFDGNTLSANSLIEDVKKQVVFAPNMNILLQNCVLKCIKTDEIQKKIDDSLVILYKNKIYGSICLLCWQKILKTACFSLKILQNDTNILSPMLKHKNITIFLPNYDLIYVTKWKQNQYYSIGDVVFVEKRYKYCNYSHKSRQNFDDDCNFWEDIKYNPNTFIICKDDDDLSYCDKICGQIVQLIDNICNVMLLKNRSKIIKIRMPFEHTMHFSVHSWVDSNDIGRGKIVKITHYFEQKYAYSDIFIADECYHNDASITTHAYQNDEIITIQDIVDDVADSFRKEQMLEMFIGNTIVRDVKICNTFDVQRKIIEKNYAKIEDFCEDFNKIKTKININFCNIKPIEYRNSCKYLGTMIVG